MGVPPAEAVAVVDRQVALVDVGEDDLREVLGIFAEAEDHTQSLDRIPGGVDSHHVEEGIQGNLAEDKAVPVARMVALLQAANSKQKMTYWIQYKHHLVYKSRLDLKSPLTAFSNTSYILTYNLSVAFAKTIVAKVQTYNEKQEEQKKPYCDKKTFSPGKKSIWYRLKATFFCVLLTSYIVVVDT